ncbi:helix-turn-helix domain-containing protein [Promicromonospora sukumoe]|uniref:helix-turn-helix domain-containing protein n=1 Tax=Promicromonospora sukumoe TaxID=88382 RepID=UPI0004784D80|nr:helix-turn-helix domain-containing protein [Promicromonospora sukumoe]
MRNSGFRETEIVEGALRRVTDLLPGSWELLVRRQVRNGSLPFDAVVELVAPTRERVSFVIEALRSGTLPTNTLIDLLLALERPAGVPLLFVSDYIGPTVRRAAAEKGINFADTTGWVRIVNDNPLILLTGQGADRSPRTRSSSAVTRLNGRAAGRTVRALAAAQLPVGVRDLAAIADVAPSSVSKLLVTLASEGIVDRDSDGSVLAVRRRSLIGRWARDYDYAKSNTSVGYYIAPRGIERALTRLDQQSGVTLTGSAAARRSLPPTSVPVVPMRLLALYAADPPGTARDLGLIVADRATANVVIAGPQDAAVLPDADDQRPAIAPLALVLADLLTLPGRSDAEATQLMDALAATDPSWEE